ncbi:MAG: P-loop NTPase [Acidimicrobiales bacterium]
MASDAVRDALRGVMDPELGDNIVDLGMYKSFTTSPDGRVTVQLALTTVACPLRGQLERDVKERVGALSGVTGVTVATSEMSADEKRELMARARWKARDRAVTGHLPGRTRVLAISSGKGGVGKSSICVNVSAGLAARGFHVGLLDADIAGFSVPRMLGVEGTIEARPGDGDKPLMQPVTKRIGKGSVKVLSMGFLSGEDEAIMWRGLMLNRAVQHFVEDAEWGDLDYLLIDMPPGTGDVQMGLARHIPRAEMLIVTTPALAAQKVAARAADMARRGYLRVAGVIENMSGFTCAHGERYDLFGSGGGARLAAEIGVPLLGCIPLEPAIAAGADAGQPAALGEGAAAEAFAALVDAVVGVAPVVDMEGCSARLQHRLEAALGPAVVDA